MPYYSSSYLARLSGEERARLLASAAPLGSHPETGDTLFLPDADRYAGAYILGIQGVGKSTLIEQLIAHDAKVGNAVVVIDPHGDLTAHCLAQLPNGRIPQTYVLDMEDEAYPFGVNVFATSVTSTSVAQTQAVERIMHIFEVLWDDVLSQQHLPRYVRAATITFLANPGATLVDMHTFLLDAAFRRRMLEKVSDPTVRQFWQSQFDDLSQAEQMRRIQPLINRLEALFMGRSLIRNIVGQRRTTINFRTAIERRELVFIKLPVKTIAQDARLIGTVMIAQLHAAIFSFADIPERERPGLSLYVDEFQHFSTSDFAELFTEGRKFGVKVTVAHQYRGQLPSFLQQSTMTARTKICFQTTPEDGREMAHLFPAQDEGVRREDSDPHPVEYLLAYGLDDPSAKVLIDTYLRPLQSQKRGGRVEIDHPVWTWNFWDGARKRDVYVENPIPYLNNLLFQVMRAGNSQLPIPVEAAFGFANCGRGFFSAVRNARHSPELTSDFQFPAHLVVMGMEGPRWTRPPENDREQFYHFIFHLRMVMQRLAAVPIGKVSKSSSAEVGQMLVHLPRRAAFVRSGEDTGVIYTHKVAQGISGEALAQRLATIRNQTHARYCHPRDQVERLVVNDLPSEPAPSAPLGSELPLQRWEELGDA